MPEYPGTMKGDRPEDDPEFYAMWIQENQSPLMAKISELFNQIEEKTTRNRADEEQLKVDGEEFHTTNTYDYTDYATMSTSHKDNLANPDYDPGEITETTVVNYTDVSFLHILLYTILTSCSKKSITIGMLCQTLLLSKTLL